MNGTEIDLMTIVLLRWDTFRRAWVRKDPTAQLESKMVAVDQALQALSVQSMVQALQALSVQSMAIFDQLPDAVAIVDTQSGVVLAIVNLVDANDAGGPVGPYGGPDPEPTDN